MAGQTGYVYAGLADIDNLEAAAEIREGRGAEGVLFDPAVIALLARAYSLAEGQGQGQIISHSSPSSSSSPTKLLKDMDVLEACRHNLRVAADAGLRCRSAVWATVLTLLPPDLGRAAPSVASSGTATVEKITGGVSSLCLSVGDEVGVSFADDLLGAILAELIESGDCQVCTYAHQYLRFYVRMQPLFYFFSSHLFA
jgi:hypothetical protein